MDAEQDSGWVLMKCGLITVQKVYIMVASRPIHGKALKSILKVTVS